MKKLVAIVLALAMAAAISAPVFAADEYTAALMYADNDWYPSLMSNDDPAQDTRPTITVTGDGTYSIETESAAGAAGIQVLCIDVIGLAADFPDAAITLDSIEVDGAPYEFDASKIIYGDLEENGNLRIEIYNEYGKGTKENPPFNKDIFNVKQTVKFTFTISGMGTAEAAPAETTDEVSPVETEVSTAADAAGAEAPANTAEAPKTGLAFAAFPAVIALAAAAVFRKK